MTAKPLLAYADSSFKSFDIVAQDGKEKFDGL
jgi:hypothetical protein